MNASQKYQVVQLYCKCGHELEGESITIPPKFDWDTPTTSHLLWCAGCETTWHGDEALLERDIALMELGLL